MRKYLRARRRGGASEEETEEQEAEQQEVEQEECQQELT